MVIEESTLINADIDAVWNCFVDLTGWGSWNSVITHARTASGRLEQGEPFRFELRPFAFPVSVESRIDRAIPRELIRWSGSWAGIIFHHEYLFQQTGNGVLVTSRELLTGLPIVFAKFTFPDGSARKLSAAMLNDLKKAVEQPRK